VCVCVYCLMRSNHFIYSHYSRCQTVSLTDSGVSLHAHTHTHANTHTHMLTHTHLFIMGLCFSNRNNEKLDLISYTVPFVVESILYRRKIRNRKD